jgi:arginine exporter protein ArgO
LEYAKENPVKFVAISSFLVLGAIPLVAFLGYSAVAVIASCIVAVIVDLFVISIGAIGLSFVLFVATCMTVCATSVFAGFYFTYRMASGAIKGGFRLDQKSTWPTTVHSPE